jgi:hypothetical protein
LVVRLTDAPAPYERVDVIVRSLKVHALSAPGVASDSGWSTVLGRELSVDLLSLRNGVELPLSSVELRAGSYDRFQIEVSEASVVQDGVAYSVPITTREKTIVYPFEVRAGDTLAILIDFDASASITLAKDGSLVFSPAIKVIRESRD